MNSTAQPLSPSDLQTLERDSWIDPPTAEAFGIRRVSSSEGAALVGRQDREDYAGLVFSTFWPGDERPRENFLRRDRPSLEYHRGELKPRQRYLAPPGRNNLLLFGPGESPDSVSDTALPVLVTEGLKKTAAARRLAWMGGSPAFLACGFSGSWNFRGTIGRTEGPDGTRVSIKGYIPDLDRVTWEDRDVFIAFDSDAETNPSVSAARETIAEELRRRGARVVVMVVPPLDNLAKTGLDDLLASWGPERVLEWLHTAQTNVVASEDPEPISLDAHDVPPFQTDLITASWLRAMVDAVARATETPIELALLLSLAVVATSVQRKYEIEPEPGYLETLNLWILVALDSGNRKTAVLKAMTAPLFEFERQHAAMMAPKVAEAEAARRLAEDRIKYLRAKAAKASGADRQAAWEELRDEEAAVPEVPKPVRVWAQDVTIEKLGQLMAENGGATAIFSDEGGFFDILAGRYSQNGGPNLDLALQGHSGAPVRVDRGSRSPVHIDSAILTCAFTPQPDVLKSFANQPSFRGRGFLARYLYAMPRSPLGRRTLETWPVPDEVRQQYDANIQALLKLPPREDGKPHQLHFSHEAYPEWKAFQRHVEDELPDGGTFEHIRDWASKHPGAVARLAGVLHCAEHADGNPAHHPVSLATMEAALALGALLERHALAAFSLMAVDSALEAAQKVWAWVLRQRHPQFSRRDCHQALRGSFPDLASIQPAFEVLMERGYLFPLLQDKRAGQAGRPSPGYRINSRIAKEWQ